MAENFVNVDRDTPMLLPADLRQWVPEDDLVHFVINAVDTMRLAALRVNERGSGSKQYPPRMIILATDVLSTPSDANELPVAWGKVVQSVGPVQRMLADGGYVNAETIGSVGQKVEPYVAIARADNSYRRYDFRPRKKRTAKKLVDPRLKAMRKKVTSDEGRRIFRRRAATVEPVFGIIKAALGLRQFLLRGIEKVRIEWDLVCLAYNTRRLWSLSRA